jgi:glycosyltransferase involved in cell wall biosynthesis
LFSGAEYLDRVIKASDALPVTFLGWQDDVSSILADLDLLVVPSSPADSAPRVIYEAFAAGVPVVAFPSGGIPEIVQDEETGFLTTAITAEALAQRIRSVLKMDHASLQATVDRAWKRWEEKYTLATYREHVAEFLFQAVVG